MTQKEKEQTPLKDKDIANVVHLVLCAASDVASYEALTADDKLVVLKSATAVVESRIGVGLLQEAMRRSLGNMGR